LLFPGFSYELSLDYIIEHYPSFDETCQTVFVEVRRQRSSDWLFALDFKDLNSFDKAAVEQHSMPELKRLRTQHDIGVPTFQ
jgi:hypothetical protein